MIIWGDSPTDESIARAKAARDAERRDIEAKAGLRIRDDGRPALLIQHCHVSGCRYAASAISEGRVMRSLMAHYLRVHTQQMKES